MNKENRQRIVLLGAMLLVTIMSWAGLPGVPFYKSITSSEYNAHSRNYDVACDDYGTVFVANFEGLLYFDGATWRKLYTPGISRVTCLARGNNGRIWYGGHNVFGYITSDRTGSLKLNTIVSDAGKQKLSDVDLIRVTSDKVYVHTTLNKIYYVVGDKSLKFLKNDADKQFLQAYAPVRKMSLVPMALQKQYEGGITSITHNRQHALWGATDNGLFWVDTPSIYSRLGEGEGLKGEVNNICQMGTTYYIATMQGLYYVNGTEAHQIPGVSLACWQLMPISGHRIVVAASEGLLMYSGNTLGKITSDHTLSVCLDTKHGGYITGEIDGIYYVSASGSKTKISDVEKAVNLSYKADKVKALSIYGEEWELTLSEAGGKMHAKSRCVKKNIDKKTIMPSARVMKWVTPFISQSINCLHESSEGIIALGGEFGAYFIDTRLGSKDMSKPCQQPYIRQIVAMGDSVMWGGYTKGTMVPRYNVDEIELPYNCDNIVVTYSTVSNVLAYPMQYRYRIDEGNWSQWSSENKVEMHNISYHTTTIEIQARNVFGNVSAISKVTWYKNVPFYLTWWAYLIYFVLINFLLFKAIRWRMRRLMRQKQELETLVDERTSDLRRTQADLVHMERRATAGKLTQGLIDRILNPINYINNFSKLTSGLANDLKEDIEDEKEHMTEENYEDCEDILDMMHTNLAKIEEHGVSTTRTLRAMEAMLNNKVGALTQQNLVPLCLQAVTVTRDYHKDVVNKYGIEMKSDVPSEPVMIDMDAESLNRAIIALLNNCVYSVGKKAKALGAGYKPEVVMVVSKEESSVIITVRDNGVGIEQTIIDKVFDPFFTTKPTSEASGVGLYLAKNIINDHHGTITVASVKGEYCEFTIKL